MSFSIDACQLTSLYFQIKGPFISEKLQPLSQVMPTPNRFPSKVSIRTTHMLSAFSNEPPNRIGSSDTKPDPIYVQMAMRSTAEWVFGRPTSLGAPPGMPSRPCSRSMDRADGTSTARPQRSAGLRWYFMTWRESYSRVIITYRTFRICALLTLMSCCADHMYRWRWGGRHDNRTSTTAKLASSSLGAPSDMFARAMVCRRGLGLGGVRCQGERRR